MANTIKLKRGTSTPSTSDISSGEVAIDTSAKKLYINDSGTVKEIGGTTNASNLSSGTLPNARLATTVNVTALTATTTTVTTSNATSFVGSGDLLTSLRANQLSGTVAAARLDTATTQSAGNNSTKIATTAYTDTAISNLVDSSPSALNTLNELAAALGDDANFSTTVTNSIATKAVLSGSTNNTICTVTGANTIQGEASLTYNGTTLGVTHCDITTELKVDAIQYSNANAANLSVRYNSWLIQSAISSKFIEGTTAGQVKFYHSNALKAETVSSGFTVTGTCTATAFAGDGSSLTNVSASDSTKLPLAGGSLTGSIDLGSNDVTSRYVYAKDIFLGDVSPELRFTDSDNSPDYQIRLNSGILDFKDITNSVSRMSIQADGHVDIAGNLDVGAGIDVTGNIAVTENISLAKQKKIKFFDSSTQQGYIELDGSNDIIHHAASGVEQVFYAGGNTNLTLASGTATFAGNVAVSGTVDEVDIATRDLLFGGLTSVSGVLTDGVTATTQSTSDNTTKVATTAFTQSAIGNATITGSQISTNAISTTKIADDAITTAKLAADAVTAAELSNNIVNNNKLTANAVITSKIANDAVTTDKINLISTSSVPSLEAKGDGSSQDGYIQLNCSQNSHGVKLKSPPHSANASYTLTLPNTDGNSNQVLKTDGSGGLDWVDQTAAYTNASVDAHLNQSNPTSGHVLSWNGSDYAWVAQSGGGGGSGISNLVEDTTPQLGGNLDMQSNNISGTGTITATSVASSASGMRKITASTSTPSGGADGDIHIKYS